jgi:hypothetical protein
MNDVTQELAVIPSGDTAILKAVPVAIGRS